jgi:hypothetical protein
LTVTDSFLLLTKTREIVFRKPDPNAPQNKSGSTPVVKAGAVKKP